MIKQNWKSAAIALLSVGVLTAQPTQAITIINGSFEDLADGAAPDFPPNAITQGSFESNDTIFFFDEGITTLGGLVVLDASVAGAAYNSGNRTPALLDNTTVRSFYFSFDPTGGSQSVSGTVEFDTDIIGLIFSSGSGGNPNTLAFSDGTLGRTDIAYTPANVFRGIETNDSITWQIDNRTLSFDNLTVTGATVDQIRVVTAIPFEAETTAGLALISFYFGWRRLRQKN